MEIRNVNLEDAALVAEIYNYYIKNTSQTFETEVLGADEMSERIAEVSADYPYLVAEEDCRTGSTGRDRADSRCLYRDGRSGDFSLVAEGALRRRDRPRSPRRALPHQRRGAHVRRLGAGADRASGSPAAAADEGALRPALQALARAFARASRRGRRLPFARAVRGLRLSVARLQARGRGADAAPLRRRIADHPS